MMFKTALFAMLAALATPTAAQSTLELAQTTLVRPAGPQSMPARVPRGKTYAIRSGNSNRFSILRQGTKTTGTDCAQVPCPGSFDKDITCWKCVESLTSN
ncbi:MAG: hypothetical protein P1U53_05875 [Sulfitobacter sp.]|nr:hypothetical protein [Sulfitobacter sp.]